MAAHPILCGFWVFCITVHSLASCAGAFVALVSGLSFGLLYLFCFVFSSDIIYVVSARQTIGRGLGPCSCAPLPCRDGYEVTERDSRLKVLM